MKKLLVVINLAFCVTIFLLFRMHSSQADEIEALRREMRDASNKTSDLRDEIRTVRSKAWEQAEAVSQAFTQSNSIASGQLAALSVELGKQKAEIAIARAASEKDEAALNSLKVDLAKGVESGLTKDVVKTSAELVLKNMDEAKTLLKDQAFQVAIAKTLVTNYRQELRGPAGSDADNAVVAKMLVADPDFLNRVSISTIVQAEKQSAPSGK